MAPDDYPGCLFVDCGSGKYPARTGKLMLARLRRIKKIAGMLSKQEDHSKVL